MKLLLKKIRKRGQNESFLFELTYYFILGSHNIIYSESGKIGKS